MQAFILGARCIPGGKLEHCACMQAWQLMFDSVDTANDCIRIATGVLSTIKINPKKMLAGLSPDMLATDLAEYLVRKGMPQPCLLWHQ